MSPPGEPVPFVVNVFRADAPTAPTINAVELVVQPDGLPNDLRGDATDPDGDMAAIRTTIVDEDGQGNGVPGVTDALNMLGHRHARGVFAAHTRAVELDVEVIDSAGRASAPVRVHARPAEIRREGESCDPERIDGTCWLLLTCAETKDGPQCLAPTPPELTAAVAHVTASDQFAVQVQVWDATMNTQDLRVELLPEGANGAIVLDAAGNTTAHVYGNAYPPAQTLTWWGTVRGAEGALPASAFAQATRVRLVAVDMTGLESVPLVVPIGVAPVRPADAPCDLVQLADDCAPGLTCGVGPGEFTTRCRPAVLPKLAVAEVFVSRTGELGFRVEAHDVDTPRPFAIALEIQLFSQFGDDPLAYAPPVALLPEPPYDGLSPVVFSGRVMTSLAGAPRPLRRIDLPTVTRVGFVLHEVNGLPGPVVTRPLDTAMPQVPLGRACDPAGAIDECVAGARCTQARDGDWVCLD